MPAMRTDTPQAIRLADYRPPAFLIDQAHLTFDLKPNATRVKARLEVRRNGEHADPLTFNGERLKAISVAIDGRVLGEGERTIDGEVLVIPDAPDAFTLETEVEIDPEANKALDGLYMSAGRFCTQCEAEGFRKITFWPDRPDVLSRFTVRIEADKAYPRLLSNGNLMENGDLPGGRHYAVWNDPFPKPCYLFALVAGELDVLEDKLVTMTGRTVDLRIYVDPGMAPRAAYAMDALKRSMKWDEETFGREYDLDLFMIVAVRDFNFGAMENKGLNIFNSSLLLADPATATDMDFERIESVVAHEYFHNWTGDRITCRDWFQLCLKEGLTVFRDQSFSADMRGHAVQRIKDVKALRARQFAEDQGPLSHPVRPSSYLKIDNFYTATIYEKGAEVIRMLKTLIGSEAFRAGMDLYFERWDGHATTVEEFIRCFAEASDQDLAAFFAWELRHDAPLLPLRLFRDRSFSVANVVGFGFSFGMFGAVFILIQFLQVVQGSTPLQAAYQTTPWTMAPMIVAPLAGIVAPRVGTRVLIAAGLALQAIALFWLGATMSATSTYLDMLTPFILAGIGMGLVFSPSSTAVLATMREQDRAKASGVNSTIREIGIALGIAVLTAVFTGLNGQLTPTGYVSAAGPAVIVGAAVVAATLVVSLFLPSGRLPRKVTA